MVDYFFAFLAGGLTLLSPCVLPILPIVLAGAAQARASGPIFLAIGLAISFTGSGLILNSLGPSLGITYNSWHYVGAIILLAMGFFLLVPALERGMARIFQPISMKAHKLSYKADVLLSPGSFLLPSITGLLLGAVWLPCTGPTLGAALGLAAKQKDLPHAASIMFLFSLGAVMPLLLFGVWGHSWMEKRKLISHWAGKTKQVLGGIFVLMGFLAISGMDKRLESYLVELSPYWLTDLTTRF